MASGIGPSTPQRPPLTHSNDSIDLGELEQAIEDVKGLGYQAQPLSPPPVGESTPERGVRQFLENLENDKDLTPCRPRENAQSLNRDGKVELRSPVVRRRIRATPLGARRPLFEIFAQATDSSQNT